MSSTMIPFHFKDWDTYDRDGDLAIPTLLKRAFSLEMQIPNHQRKGTEMSAHPSRSIYLVKDDVQTIRTRYNPDKEREVKDFKCYIPGVKVGDFVIVPTTTRYKMTIVEVVEIDIEPDFESGSPIDWVISRVDRTHHQEVTAWESKILNHVKAAEKLDRKRDLAEKIKAAMGEDAHALLAGPAEPAESE